MVGPDRASDNFGRTLTLRVSGIKCGCGACLPGLTDCRHKKLTVQRSVTAREVDDAISVSRYGESAKTNTW